MDAAAAAASVQTAQAALQVLASLAFTGYLFPTGCTVTNGTSYNFIIVGGGSAGSVIANRLTEIEGITGLLIEAGGDPPMESVYPGTFTLLPGSVNDWNLTSVNDGYTAQHMKNNVVGLTSGKMLGGGSALHHLLHVRGDPYDFNSWAEEIGDDSWNYDNVLPYFIKSESVKDDEIMNSNTSALHGTDGYLSLTREPSEENIKYLEAFAELGHNNVLDTNCNNTLGYTEPMLNIYNGTRQCGAQAYLSPIKDRKNLCVLKNTLVTKILFDSDNNATGVEAVTEDGEKLILYASNEVILSAGALSTPKLLMLSGIGPSEHLESLSIDVISDLPVGENMQDHPPAIVVHKMQESNATAPAINPHEFPVPTTTGYVALNESQSYPDYQTINLVFPHDSSAILQFCSVVFSYSDDICQKIYESSSGRDILFTVHNLLHPKSRGKVVLNSTDPLDPPLVYTGTYRNETDLNNMAAYLEDFAKVVNTTYFKNVSAELVDLEFSECANITVGTLDYWKCYALAMSSTMWHYSSTCAMGSVVDTRLLVKGVQKLRVVDASAMPKTTSGNINAAVVMLAEKAADIIKEYWELS